SGSVATGWSAWRLTTRRTNHQNSVVTPSSSGPCGRNLRERSPHARWRITMRAGPHVTLTKLRDNWRRFVDNHRSMAELAACPSNELQHIAQDIGLSPAALKFHSFGHPSKSALMPRRLQQLG